MTTKSKVLALYRSFYTLTRDCPDRSLKLYIRRRAQEDFKAGQHLPPNDAAK
jgi:hypothetical protein